ncbi:MAG: response regulator [Gammaproteobacteria bacterium]
MARLLLVDDHRLVRTALKRLLEASAGIDGVAEAGSGDEAIGVAKLHSPDVILMGITLPGIGGLESTRRLLRINSQFKIIILATRADAPVALRLLQAGAIGYLTKGCTVDEMLQAIAFAQRGEQYVCAEVAQRIVEAHVNGRHARLDSLSRRELEVLLMVSEGKRNREISQRLCLSPKTVSTYRARLLSKLGVRTDVALAHIALRHGLVDQCSPIE